MRGGISCRVVLVSGETDPPAWLLRPLLDAPFALLVCDRPAQALPLVAQAAADLVIAGPAVAESALLELARGLGADVPLLALSSALSALSARQARGLCSGFSLLPAPLEPEVLTAEVNRLSATGHSSQAEAHARERFETVSRAPLGVLLLDVGSGCLLDVNSRFSKLTGYSREEAVGRTLAELGCLDSPEPWQRLLAAPPDAGVELALRARDGRSVVCHCTSEALGEGAGSYRLAFTLDITSSRRWKTEHEAMASLARLLNAEADSDALLRAVCLFLRDWTQCDAAAIRLKDGDDFPYCATSGYCPAFVDQERNVLVAGEATGAPQLACLCGAVLRGQLNPFLPNSTEDGSFWTGSTSELLADTDSRQLPPNFRGACCLGGLESLALIPFRIGGRIAGLLQLADHRKDWFGAETVALLERAAASLAAALEYRRTELELRESREKLQAIADHTVDWENWFGPRGDLIWVNPAVLCYTGYSPEECYAMPDFPFGLVYHEDRPAFRSYFDAAREGGRGMDVEFRRELKDGALRWSSVSWQPIFDSTGRSMGHRSTIRDISDRKQAAQERAALEAQVRQAQRLESLGQLAGGVAHDFNNFLTVISGYADLLERRMSPQDPLLALVGEIRRSGEQAARLTHQLLAFGRKQMVEAHPLNLNSLVADSLPLLERLAGDDIEISTRLDAALGPVLVDPGQMQQALMNLVVNARDAMPGGGKLSISTAAVTLDEAQSAALTAAHPGAYSMLEVRDTGCGIPADQLGKIFEPFYTTKTEGKGIGLGLSTVYGSVHQAGGVITVASPPGAGATFRIFLPQVQAVCLPPEVLTQPEPPEAGSETVLVVEDRDDIRRLTIEILEGFGYQVLEAASLTQALDLCQRHTDSIDLLLVDAGLSHGTAVTLWEQLRRSRPETRALFMSSFSRPANGQRAALPADVPVIVKPFSPAQLAQQVRQVLGPMKRSGDILVVDDEAGIRNLFRHVLEDAGYTVHLAADGNQALKIVRSQRLDAVVTDLVMPEREGIETIQAIKRQWPKLKILAVSGAFGGRYLKAAQKLGADATLLKPVRAARLLATVRRLLESGRAVGVVAGR